MTSELRAAVHRADVAEAAFWEIQGLVEHVETLLQWLCSGGETWPYRNWAFYAQEAAHVFGPITTSRVPGWLGRGVRLDGTHERTFEDD